MSHQKIRGTDWEMPQESARRGYDAKETVARPFNGFRLVHDDAGRVNRGISWDDSDVSARAAYRGMYNPGRRGGYLGFRLAREEK